jgi:hypothetical protein
MPEIEYKTNKKASAREALLLLIYLGINNI